MHAVHNAKNSQTVAVLLTLILELFFSFMGGWTLYDTFISWGLVPAIIIGAVGGLALFLLALYVFIYREYAVDAVKVFSAKRGEVPNGRLLWAGFLVFCCVGMDSFFNADRMVNLPAASIQSKLFMWIGLQLFVFVPLALGKLVHAHINTVDVSASRQGQLSAMVDKTLMLRMEEVIPTLNAAELIALRSGDVAPLKARLNAVDAEKQAAVAPPQDHFKSALAGLLSGQTAQRDTGPQNAVK